MDYQKLYLRMFNAATDALLALEELNIGHAKEVLKQAQMDAEEQYISETAELEELPEASCGILRQA